MFIGCSGTVSDKFLLWQQGTPNSKQSSVPQAHTIRLFKHKHIMTSIGSHCQGISYPHILKGQLFRLAVNQYVFRLLILKIITTGPLNHAWVVSSFGLGSVWELRTFHIMRQDIIARSLKSASVKQFLLSTWSPVTFLHRRLKHFIRCPFLDLGGGETSSFGALDASCSGSSVSSSSSLHPSKLPAVSSSNMSSSTGRLSWTLAADSDVEWRHSGHAIRGSGLSADCASVNRQLSQNACLQLSCRGHRRLTL